MQEPLPEGQLLSLNRQGLVPGPNEAPEAFVQRAERVFEEREESTCAAATALTLELFDFQAHWVKVVYATRSLRPWEAAATWVKSGEAPIIAVRKKPSRLYSQGEVLAHEMLHAMRAGFPRSKYEEVLAYFTSKNRWRRSFGPLFHAAWESTLTLILCTLAFALEMCFPHHQGLALLLPVSLAGVLLLRLWHRHAVVAKALRSLSRVTRWPIPLLVRLTDEEIEMCAQGVDIKAYAQKQDCLRWRMITLAYL